MCLTASTVTVPSWILQIEPSPSLLQGSKVKPHPLAHAQFATFNSVQRLSPKKGASDKNSPTGRDRASRARGSFPLFAKCRSQTNERGIWPGNETSYAHAYKIRKWRPSQRTATTECCEWPLLIRVNLRL